MCVILHKRNSVLPQDDLCVVPRSLWSRLQCSQRKHQEERRNSDQEVHRTPDQTREVRRTPDQNREVRRTRDQNQEVHRNPAQNQQSRGAGKGQIRIPADLRRSLFPSFSEMVFQMQQTMGKSKENQKPKDLELGRKMSGKGLEEAIMRLKATEERRRRRRVGEREGKGEGRKGGEGGGREEGEGGGGGLRNGRFERKVEKELLWRGHQCYYNPASCY